MIFVKRSEKPEILIKKEKEWTQEIKKLKKLFLADASEANKKALDKAVKRYGHEKIKESLIEMFHGKCAFCESFIQNIDYGDIEHFRPKSKFPELAVTWENLLLSCKKCNGASQKGDKWPSEEEGGLLINPCNEHPENFFEFEFDEMTLLPIVKPKNLRGKTSEFIYGLNKSDLLNDRKNHVRMLVAIAKNYHEDQEARSILDEAILDSSEYAAFARMVKAKYAS